MLFSIYFTTHGEPVTQINQSVLYGSDGKYRIWVLLSLYNRNFPKSNVIQIKVRKLWKDKYTVMCYLEECRSECSVK